MAKYSTGRGGGASGGGTCELCGSESADLRTATVAGAELRVCPSCAPHGDQSERDREQNRRRRAAQNAAKAADRNRVSSRHWVEEGPNYDRDQLPYLVRDYGDRVERARQSAGLQRDELAAELDIDEHVLLAIEQGRATQAGVGGSAIRALEEHLGVELVDEE